MIRTGLVAVVLVACSPTNCWAWGTEGHQIIAHIAARELTPSARLQVQELLGGSDAERVMVEASTWADEVRPQRPETAPWHFVNIPIGSGGYNAQRDCRRGDCIVGQIEREQWIVGDRALLTPVRAEALRFLIHLIGDLHQPLHAINNNDRGGNDTRVTIDRRGIRTNLHAVWDNYVVRNLGTKDDAVAIRLEAEIQSADQQRWKSGSVIEWVNESFQIARREIYSGTGSFTSPTPGAVVILPEDYARDKRAIVRMQLEKAGVRLAWVLNSAF